MALRFRALFPSLTRSVLHVYRLLLPAVGMLLLLSAVAPAQQETDQSKSAAISAARPSGNEPFVTPIARTESPRQTLAAMISSMDQGIGRIVRVGGCGWPKIGDLDQKIGGRRAAASVAGLDGNRMTRGIGRIEQ